MMTVEIKVIFVTSRDIGAECHVPKKRQLFPAQKYKFVKREVVPYEKTQASKLK